ncbi:MAG: DUF547 domain-containing protein [Bacteroidota bacterium]
MKTLLFLSAVAILLSCSSTTSTSEELAATQSEAVDLAIDVAQSEIEAQVPEKEVVDQQAEANGVSKVTDPAEVQKKNQDFRDKTLETRNAVARQSPDADIGKNDMRLQNSKLENNSETEQSPIYSEIDPAQLATEAWGNLLSTAVSNSGKVDYEKIKSEQATLDGFLEATASGPPSGTLAARAYWINQYNAYTIKLILDNWPVSSIKNLHGGKPWDVKWINVGGETLSLNQIEFEKLRPGDTDARIHFAVNCAAASCPPLYNRLFTAGNLESTLERLAVKFINNTHHNKIDSSPWQLSSIFNWYGDDFRDLELFVMERAQNEVDAPGEIEFLEYDWGLND